MGVDRPDWSGSDDPPSGPVEQESNRGNTRPDWDGSESEVVPSGATHLRTEYTEVAQELEARDKQDLAEIAAEAAADEKENAEYMAGLPVLSEPGDLPAELTADWKADPAGHDFRHRMASEAVSVIEELDEGDRNAIVGSFENLSDSIQTKILGELSLGPSGSVRPADEGEMSSFAAMDAGAALLAHWGQAKSPRLVEAVLTRLERIESDMSPGAREAFAQWFEDLPRRAQMAALIALV